MAEFELLHTVLGLTPYTLIEATKDPADGELVLSVKSGGGADNVGVLPMLLLTGLPADNNPITDAIRMTLADNPGDRAALARFAEMFGVPMPGVSDG